MMFPRFSGLADSGTRSVSYSMPAFLRSRATLPHGQIRSVGVLQRYSFMPAILSRAPRSSSFLHCRVAASYVGLGGSPRTHDTELRVFYLSYIGAELRRRAGRTALTALGLGVGVGLVVTVTALSNGLDNAQQKVLKPLTGVGTDMAVTRPLRVSNNGQSFTPGGGGPGGAGAGLSQAERDALRKENGGGRLNLRSAGKPGTHFSRDTVLARNQLSFPASPVQPIAG